MENVRFIKEIAAHGDMDHQLFGDLAYYKLDNGNRAKAYCIEDGVAVRIINPKFGEVDNVHLPFSHYFAPVRLSESSPTWYQHITHMNGEGRWEFEKQYPHVLPKAKDYRNLANAIEAYIHLFDVTEGEVYG